MHSAESFNNRALIRSSPIALLVFKVFNCLRKKDSVILQKENDLLLPFHREKVGGKYFLELLAISRSYSYFWRLASFRYEGSAYLEPELFQWVPYIKHRPPQLTL